MAVYTLLETARANGLNPLKYLEFLLEARPNYKMSDEELEELAPWSNTVQECCVNNQSKMLESQVVWHYRLVFFYATPITLHLPPCNIFLCVITYFMLLYLSQLLIIRILPDFFKFFIQNSTPTINIFYCRNAILFSNNHFISYILITLHDYIYYCSIFAYN